MNNNKKMATITNLTSIIHHPSSSILSHHGWLAWLGHGATHCTSTFWGRWVLWWKHELWVLFPLHLRKAHQVTKHLRPSILYLFLSPFVGCFVLLMIGGFSSPSPPFSVGQKRCFKLCFCKKMKDVQKLQSPRILSTILFLFLFF